MQLETIRTQTKNGLNQTVVNFVVFADGVAAGAFSTQASAWAYQDTLWAAAQNKTMEALYAGR